MAHDRIAGARLSGPRAGLPHFRRLHPPRRGSKKGTAYAAQVAAEKVLSEAKTFGLSRVDVIVKGIGLGREAAIRTLSSQKIAIESIKDETGIPHGGVRPRKAKRN